MQQSPPETLEVWLSTHTVDLKREDAMEMLKAIKNVETLGVGKTEPCFYFNWTYVWDVAFRERQLLSEKASTLSVKDQGVIDALRLDPGLYQHYNDKALISWICRNRLDLKVDDSTLKVSLDSFREDNKLNSRVQLIDYMEKTDLDEVRLKKLLGDLARVNLEKQAAGFIFSDIINQLKIDGRYLTLVDTADLNKDEASVSPKVTD
ncbi:hypothetical protein OAM69_03095 [bacterium]|nr:hypothetical protein [bacterium]